MSTTVLEDWAYAEFNGYMIMTGHVPTQEARVSTSIVESVSDASGALTILCENGDTYTLGDIDSNFYARCPTARARMQQLVGKEIVR